jgi:hypothetical protein
MALFTEFKDSKEGFYGDNTIQIFDKNECHKNSNKKVLKKMLKRKQKMKKKALNQSDVGKEAQNKKQKTDEVCGEIEKSMYNNLKTGTEWASKVIICGFSIYMMQMFASTQLGSSGICFPFGY